MSQATSAWPKHLMLREGHYGSHKRIEFLDWLAALPNHFPSETARKPKHTLHATSHLSSRIPDVRHLVRSGSPFAYRIGGAEGLQEVEVSVADLDESSQGFGRVVGAEALPWFGQASAASVGERGPMVA